MSIRNYRDDFFIRQGDRQKDDAVLPPRARNGNQFFLGGKMILEEVSMYAMFGSGITGGAS